MPAKSGFAIDEIRSICKSESRLDRLADRIESDSQDPVDTRGEDVEHAEFCRCSECMREEDRGVFDRERLYDLFDPDDMDHEEGIECAGRDPEEIDVYEFLDRFARNPLWV